MNNKLLREIKLVFNYGVSQKTNSIDNLYYKMKNNKTFLIIRKDNYINDLYQNFIRNNPNLNIKSIFFFYKGCTDNSMVPNGSGKMILIVEILDFELGEYNELETFEGIWEAGVLKEGTYTTETEEFWINYPIVETSMYEFYHVNILKAGGNIGKRTVSSKIVYNGAFDENMKFSDESGKLVIKYCIDWIRLGERDKGEMVLKGRFKEGSILYGEYTGPYFGFGAIYDKPAKYEGCFKNNVFEGTGELEYNYQGGYLYSDRIKCNYKGIFKKGLKDDSSAFEYGLDENGVCIDFIKCRYKENILEKVGEVKFHSKDYQIFGYEDEYSTYNEF